MTHLFGRVSVGGAFALTGAIALVATVRAYRDDELSPPAANLALEVVHPGSVDVAPGDTLHAGDELQFRVSFDVPGQLAIVALDEDGTITMYLAPSVVPAGRGRVLDGAIVVDPSRGAERVVAVWCPESLGVIGKDAILSAARAINGDARSRVPLALPCEQATTWFDQL